MRELRLFKTLVFYDRPELMVGTDQLGMEYVCVLVATSETTDSYLCVPVSEGRLRQLLASHLDLRQLFERPETDEVYTATVIEGTAETILLAPITVGQIGEEWLPAAGFYLTPDQPADDSIVAAARERNRAVFALRLRPPESWAQPVISAMHLSQGVRLFQRLIKYAYGKAINKLDSVTHTLVNNPEQCELEVYATSLGSFTVHMQVAMPADLLGYSQVAKAIDIVDRVCQAADDPERALLLVAEHGGHFATSLKDLLRFIQDSETAIEYQWSMPQRNDSTTRQIAVRSAGPLYEVLATRLESTKEVVRLVGTLSKVDLHSGTWRLTDELSGRERSGFSDPGVTLAGTEIKTGRYEFICEERLEEEAATGREFTRLYLSSWRSLPSPNRGDIDPMS